MTEKRRDLFAELQLLREQTPKLYSRLCRPVTITSYSFVVALTEHLLCAACLVWRLLRASSRPVARQCRRRTTPTNGASGRLVRTRHDAAPSHAKALSASRRPNC